MTTPDREKDSAVEPIRVDIEELTLSAADSTRIRATLFSSRDDSRGSVVIAGAIGVRQVFYARFASFLASRGFRVLTFDYRGIGASPIGGNLGVRGGLRAWGEQDLASAIEVALHWTHRARFIWSAIVWEDNSSA